MAVAVISLHLCTFASHLHSLSECEFEGAHRLLVDQNIKRRNALLLTAARRAGLPPVGCFRCADCW